MKDNMKYATVFFDVGRHRKRLHTDSWQGTPVFLACGYISSQDASLARERSRLTERPTGKCWRLAPVETQDYMRPYSSLCARVAVYLSPLGFSSMWLFFSFLYSYCRLTVLKEEKLKCYGKSYFIKMCFHAQKTQGLSY